MKIETNIGTIVLVGGVAFALGAQYGYHKTKERFFTAVSNVLTDELIKCSKPENKEA